MLTLDAIFETSKSLGMLLLFPALYFAAIGFILYLAFLRLHSLLKKHPEKRESEKLKDETPIWRIILLAPRLGIAAAAVVTTSLVVLL